MAILKREGQAGQQDEMRRIRDYLGRGEDFETYLATLSSDEIRQAVQAPSGSRAYMDKIDPLNSLSYLSNINEQMFGYVLPFLLGLNDQKVSQKHRSLTQHKLRKKAIDIRTDIFYFTRDTHKSNLQELFLYLT